MNALEEKAREFAIAAHGDQRYGELAYVEHLDEVVGLLGEHGHGDCKIAGYLHDVLEDTDVTRGQLEAAFGADVAAAVAFCSDEPGDNRKQRKIATYARMRRQVEAAPGWITVGVTTKVADRLANMLASTRTDPALLAKYRGEMAAFRAALHVPGVCDSMWRELEKLSA